MSLITDWLQSEATWNARSVSFSKPTPGIGDAPLYCMEINGSWRGHLLGVLDMLTQRESWSGTEAEIDAAVDAFTQLVEQLAQECTGVNLPIGTVIPFAGASVPSGYLLCDGAAIDRTAYAALFSVIGEEFGAGNGTTTFNLPDIRGRTVIGVGQGTGLSLRGMGDFGGGEVVNLLIGQIPAHTHGIKRATGAAGGNFHATMNNGVTVTDTADVTESAGGNASHNNMQPYFALNYIIAAGA